MNREEFLKKCLADISQIKYRLKQISFLNEQGILTDEETINDLLDRLNTLNKLIKELRK